MGAPSPSLGLVALVQRAKAATCALALMLAVIELARPVVRAQARDLGVPWEGGRLPAASSSNAPPRDATDNPTRPDPTRNLDGPRRASSARVSSARELSAPTPPPPSPGSHGRDVHLDFQALTYFPLMVGGAMQLELPGRLLLRIAGGTTPSAYTDVVNDVATSYGAYDASVAQTVSDFFRGSLFVEAAAGLRPLDAGLELLCGYVLFWNTPTLSTSTVGLPSGLVDPSSGSTMPTSVPVEVSLYAIHAEVAYAFDLFGFVSVRLGVGWIQTLGSDVRLGLPSSMRSLEGDPIGQSQTTFGSLLEQYARGPVLTGALGFRL